MCLTINRLQVWALLALIMVPQAHAAVTCAVTATPAIIRSEGIAERLGDVVLDCSGTPGEQNTGNINLFLNTAITNHVSSTGTLDVMLTIDPGTGPVSAGVSAQLAGTGQVAFNGITATPPANGRIQYRISNLRGTAQPQPIQVRLSASGPSFNLQQTIVTVGIAQRALAGTVLSPLVCSQAGSPLPAAITFSNLLGTGSRFATARVTEDQPSGFRPREAFEDNGTRILARFSGFPSGARLFVPDAIAGSNALRPTSTGDFGLAASPGQYQPGSGTLLLVRVKGADGNGAGGTLAPVVFDAASEVDMSNGSAVAVYEVVDANPSVRESAQIPAFLGLPASGTAFTAVTQETLALGPLAASNAVPRFTGVAAQPDCSLLGDCNADYLPRLFVDPEPTSLVATAGAGFQIRYARILNNGGGVLFWTTTANYKNGKDWLRIDPASGIGEARIRIDVLPQALSPGVYDAAIHVDAGPQAGAVDIPVHLEVKPGPVNAGPAPLVLAVVNGASFQAVPLVSDSFATVQGSDLQGSNLQLTLDGIAAKVVYADPKQINFLVPAELAGRTSAQIVVSVNGQSSKPQTVQLAKAAPGIFQPGILNEDNSINAATAPALAGTIIQVFVTGLGDAPADVKIHDRDRLTPLYAGPAPGIPGLQQVNVRVPSDLPAMTSEIVVCSTVDGVRVCSKPSRIDLRQ